MEATLEAQDTEVDAEVQSEEQAAPSKIELTPREIAIAQGQDPDAIETLSEDSAGGKDAAADLGEVPADETAESTEEVAETTEEAPAPWFDETDKFYASKYGITDDELKSFASRDQFGQAIRLLDRSVKPAPAAKTPEAATGEVDPRFDADGKVNVKYYEENFDADTVALAKALADAQSKTSQFEQFIQYQQQAQQQAAIVAYANAYHDAVDARNPEFYGKSIENGQYAKLEGTVFGERRAKLDNQIQVLEAGYRQRGMSVPPLPALIDQAESIVFRADLDKIAREKQTSAARQARQEQLNKIAAQQRRIRPVAASVGASQASRNVPPEDRHSTQAILAAPEVSRVVERIREAGPSNF